MTLCLIIAIFLCSKRDEEKAIAKLGFLPGICGISEPVVFGIPLVLNPIYAIPFAFGSGICVAIAMFATSIGFLPCNTVDVPFGVSHSSQRFCRSWLAGRRGPAHRARRGRPYLDPLRPRQQQAGQEGAGKGCSGLTTTPIGCPIICL